MTGTATKRAVIYLRVSTRDQAKRGGEAEGFSIPAQPGCRSWPGWWTFSLNAPRCRSG